jgi:hypothetical protein
MCNRPQKSCWFLAVAVTLIFCSVPSYAAGEPALQSTVEPGFTSIFNGKDLTGWEGDTRLWSVKNGVIRGRTTLFKPAFPNTFLIWRGGKVKNFVLKTKFRILSGNSGVQYRSRDLGRWRVSGYQAEICNKQGKVGFLYDERGRGWMARVGQFMLVDHDGKKRVISNVADRKALMKAGYYEKKNWNEYTIIARGNHLVHILNGHQTIEMIDNDTKNRDMEGILALQIHFGPPMVVEFKDIRIKHLPDHFGDAKLLFDAENLDGWTFSSDAVKDAFSADSGVMLDKGKPTGYIRTKADYTDYVLRFQFRHVTEGNGGVLLRMVGEDKVWPKSIEVQGLHGAVGDILAIDNFPMEDADGRSIARHKPKMHPSNEKPLGQWNQCEITLDGGNLQIKINDLLQNAAKNCWQAPGKICIQSEGAQMEYRNIVLIPIIAPGF